MDTLRGLITLLLPLLTVQATYDDKSPMVAFMCNRPAMYRSTDGWIKDDSTDCLKEPVEILNYCRKVYPSLDVRNVVESSKKVTISKWCGFGHNKCHHEFTVRPFRCLVGPFQSDALLVPEHCVFDHIHDSKECKNYEDWNKTSLQACEDRGMTLQSFAILQPCGIDRFNGVEFVCCPEEDEVDQFLHDEFEYYTTTTTIKPKQPPTFSPAATASTGRPTPSESADDVDDDVNSDAVSANDIYNKYLHLSSAEYVNEHEYFLKAKSDLEKHHHEKVTKMMKEWAEARQHVQDLKSVDPKGAEKLNKEITARFQKTYQALEQEGMAEKKQLVALHQQRVQAALNEKKRHAMEHYMDVLTDEETDAARILKALQHYIKAEQKDRLHSINHFKHLRDMDPAEAEAVREQTLNHLDLIQARIQQAVDMLNRAPKYEKKIRSQIEDYLASFAPLDSSVLEVISQPVPKAEDVMRPADVVKEFQKQQQQQQQPEQQAQPQQPQPSAQQPDEDVDSDDMDEAINTPSPAAPVVPSSSEPSKAEPQEDSRKEYYDEEVMEDEHDMVIQPQPLHGDSIHADKFEVNSYIKQEPVYAQSKFSAPTLAIAIGSVTVFVVIVVGIVVLRKRAQRVPSSRGFVEVDQAGSPEERHVANMQMNGYENPTYLYFEMNGNA